MFRFGLIIKSALSDRHTNPVSAGQMWAKANCSTSDASRFDVSIVMASSAARIGATDLDLSLSSRIFISARISRNIAD